MEPNHHDPDHMSDHDLLVTLRGDVRNMAKDVKGLGDKVDGRISKVETEVGKLQAEVDSLKIWRAVTVGALSVLVTFLIPLLVYIWQSSQNIDSAVARGVQAALSDYTVQVND